MGELLRCQSVGGLRCWVEGWKGECQCPQLAGGEEGSGDCDAFECGEGGAVRSFY